MILHRSIILASCLVLTFSTFAQKRKKKEIIKSEIEESISNDQQLQAEATLIEAEKQLILENYEKAFELFLKTAELNPGNAAVHFKLAEVLVKNGKNEEGLENIQKAIAISPDNKYYYLFEAEIHKATNDYKSAAKSYENLLEKVENSESYWLDLAVIYRYQNELDKALEAFNKAEEFLGVSEYIIREKQNIYLRSNNMEALISDWRKLIDENPDQSGYLFELASILVTNDMMKEAQQYVDEYKVKYPDDANIYLLLSEIERKKGDYRKALAKLKVPAGSREVELAVKIKAINAYLPFIQTDSMRADLQTIVDNMVKTHPDAFEALGFAGDIYLNLDSSDLALHYYRKTIQITKSNFGVWQNIVNLEYESQEYDSLIKHCDEAIEYFPNQPIFYFYGGLGHLILEDYRKSIRTLEGGVDMTTDPNLKALFYGQLGDAYYQSERYEEAYDNYEKCLEIQPSNYPVLNNYSYYLSLRGDRLDKALEMSTRLVENNPDDATFLDTHGWVLFVRGEYVQAYEFLKKAADLEEDGTIIEHLGDVYFKLGDVEKAIETWKRAKEAGETTDQIDKKIEEKQYYE